MIFLRKCRRLLAGGHSSPQPGIFEGFSAAFAHRIILFRVFYISVLLVAMSNFDTWSFHLASSDLIPLWPVGWTGYFSKNASIILILGFQLATALLGVFFCGSRSVRILVFLGLLEYVAMRNSYGKIGHSYHLLVLLSFLLIFLPRGWSRASAARRSVQAKALLVFSACQFLIMMSYSLAGLGKVAMAFYQMSQGQVHAFHPQALPLHVAQRLLETNSQSPLGPWMIDHSLLAWPMMQATLYLQLFAVVIVFRPSLQKPWAAGLILFHVFSFLILTINFPFNCFLLGLFFLTENRPPTSLRRMLADLPLFGMVFRLMSPKSA